MPGATVVLAVTALRPSSDVLNLLMIIADRREDNLFEAQQVISSTTSGILLVLLDTVMG